MRHEATFIDKVFTNWRSNYQNIEGAQIVSISTTSYDSYLFDLYLQIQPNALGLTDDEAPLIESFVKKYAPTQSDRLMAVGKKSNRKQIANQNFALFMDSLQAAEVWEKMPLLTKVFLSQKVKKYIVSVAESAQETDAFSRLREEFLFSALQVTPETHNRTEHIHEEMHALLDTEFKTTTLLETIEAVVFKVKNDLSPVHEAKNGRLQRLIFQAILVGSLVESICILHEVMGAYVLEPQVTEPTSFSPELFNARLGTMLSVIKPKGYAFSENVLKQISKGISGGFGTHICATYFLLTQSIPQSIEMNAIAQAHMEELSPDILYQALEKYKADPHGFAQSLIDNDFLSQLKQALFTQLQVLPTLAIEAIQEHPKTSISQAELAYLQSFTNF